MKKKNGFTLIELLVVVAIIAVLVAMLLPALNQARNMAKITTCSANLNQLGVGLQMYAADYYDFFPKYHYGLQWWHPDCRWYQRLYTRNYIKIKSLLYCPTNTEATPEVVDNTYNASGAKTATGYFDRGWTDYGMNVWVTSWGGVARRASLSNITDLSNTIVVTETRIMVGSYTSFVSPYYSSGSYGEGVAWPMHNGTSGNTLWADGHVTNVKAPIPGDPESMYWPEALGNQASDSSRWNPFK